VSWRQVPVCTMQCTTPHSRLFTLTVHQRHLLTGRLTYPIAIAYTRYSIYAVARKNHKWSRKTPTWRRTYVRTPCRRDVASTQYSASGVTSHHSPVTSAWNHLYRTVPYVDTRLPAGRSHGTVRHTHQLYTHQSLSSWPVAPGAGSDMGRVHPSMGWVKKTGPMHVQ